MASTEVKSSALHDGQSPSDRSPSINGKHYEDGAHVPVIDVPDPDEGLTDEERKKIVRISHLCLLHNEY
jgi:hypothetical protein